MPIKSGLWAKIPETGAKAKKRHKASVAKIHTQGWEMPPGFFSVEGKSFIRYSLITLS
jgi:hypothetical protein